MEPKEIDQQLKAFIALTQNSSLVSGSHIGQFVTLSNCSSRGFNTPFWPLQPCTYTLIYT